jgi:hypothetical protein
MFQFILETVLSSIFYSLFSKERLEQRKKIKNSLPSEGAISGLSGLGPLKGVSQGRERKKAFRSISAGRAVGTSAQNPGQIDNAEDNGGHRRKDPKNRNYN